MTVNRDSLPDLSERVDPQQLHARAVIASRMLAAFISRGEYEEDVSAFLFERDHLRAENEELLAAQGRLSSWLNENRAEATKAWTEVERLRVLIGRAPHASHCDSAASIFPGPCKCWKRDVHESPLTSDEEKASDA